MHSTVLRPLLIGGVPLAILVTWVFWDFLSRQVRFAIKAQADWGHTLVIPFIAAYLVWLNREKLLAKPFKTTWIGLVPLLLGMAWYSVCVFGPQPLHHHNYQGFGVAIALTGLVLLFVGFRAMAWLWFPLCYLFLFGQTISERFIQIITFKLQDWTAIGASWVLMLLGLDLDRDGNTIVLYDDGERKPLNIAEACSGMRMLMAFFALGVVMAYTGLSRMWQRVLLVAMGVPTAIVVNVLRVVTLSLLSMVDADFAAGQFHSFIGLVWLVPAFLIYLAVMWVIRNMVIDEARAAT